MLVLYGVGSRPPTGLGDSYAFSRLTPIHHMPKVRVSFRVLLVIALAVAGRGVPAGAAPPQLASRVASSDTAGVRERIDSVTALATFDSAWRTVGLSLQSRNVGRLDWDGVRRELRPTAARAGSNSVLRGIIDAMLRRVGESHFAIMPSSDAEPGSGSGGRSPSTLGSAGLSVRFVEGRLAVWRVDSGGAAGRAGVRAGAVVERIDNLVLPELEARDSLGLRRLTVLMRATRALAGDPGTSVRIVVRTDAGATREFVFSRDSVHGPVSRFGNLPPLPATFESRRVTLSDARCIGVMRFEYWLPPVIPAIDRAVDEVRDCAGVVIDLRGNLGGVAGMMMGVAGHFLNDERVLGTMRSRGEEMRFVANPRRATAAGVAVVPYAGPVAIVVDGLSASTSEMFAAALQGTKRARVFGERTAGQALPAMATRLPNGDILMYVIADFVTPDGTRIEGRGVIPDESVPLRFEALRMGRDAALEAAVRWVERARPDTASR